MSAAETGVPAEHPHAAPCSILGVTSDFGRCCEHGKSPSLITFNTPVKSQLEVQVKCIWQNSAVRVAIERMRQSSWALYDDGGRSVMDLAHS